MIFPSQWDSNVKITVKLTKLAAVVESEFKDPILGFHNIISFYLNKKTVEIEHLDIWDIELKVGDSGEILSIGEVELKEKEKVIKKKMKTPFVRLDTQEGKEVISKTWKRKLVNYCSLGIDARIGLGFDKRRTKSRFFNKAVYACEGVKKLCCVGGGGPLKGKIEKMEVVVEAKERDGETDSVHNIEGNLKKDITQKYNNDPDNEGNEIKEAENLKTKKLGDWKITTKPVFLSSPEFGDTTGKMNNPNSPEEKKFKSPKENLMKFNPVNLILLNINSYAGGIKNMWNKSSKKKLGIDTDNKKYASFKQKPNDGKIEFISFNNRFYFGMCERGCTGGGRRMAQGK